MSKYKIVAFVIALSFFTISSAVNAIPIFVGDTDELITDSSQSQQHQDNIDNVNWLVNDYNNDIDPDIPYPLFLLGKWEVDDNMWDGGIDPGFTGDFTGGSGTWFAPAAWSGPIYYSIKTANQNSNPPGGFELYYANGDLSGFWDTTGLGNHGLSHISFWSANASPVPEPTTMLLFGTGLVGLAGISIRRKKK